MINLRNIEKYFEHGPTKTFVLRRVNMEIKEGEFVSIMGPSGAGKSTLLHLIGMHDSAWTGEYSFLDHPIQKLKKKDRDEIYKKYFGFVFQSYHLLDSLTVYENLDIPLSYRNVKKSERDGIVCDVLDRFQMVGKKDLFPNQLSGGQQQLVAIARAIIANPKVILADEPTGNLHSSQAKEIMEVFKKLNLMIEQNRRAIKNIRTEFMKMRILEQQEREIRDSMQEATSPASKHPTEPVPATTSSSKAK